jgi:hypothetical protein
MALSWRSKALEDCDFVPAAKAIRILVLSVANLEIVALRRSAQITAQESTMFFITCIF